MHIFLTRRKKSLVKSAYFRILIPINDSVYVVSMRCRGLWRKYIYTYIVNVVNCTLEDKDWWKHHICLVSSNLTFLCSTNRHTWENFTHYQWKPCNIAMVISIEISAHYVKQTVASVIKFFLWYIQPEKIGGNEIIRCLLCIICNDYNKCWK